MGNYTGYRPSNITLNKQYFGELLYIYTPMGPKQHISTFYQDGENIVAISIPGSVNYQDGENIVAMTSVTT